MADRTKYLKSVQLKGIKNQLQNKSKEEKQQRDANKPDPAAKNKKGSTTKKILRLLQNKGAPEPKALV